MRRQKISSPLKQRLDAMQPMIAQIPPENLHSSELGKRYRALQAEYDKALNDRSLAETILHEKQAKAAADAAVAEKTRKEAEAKGAADKQAAGAQAAKKLAARKLGNQLKIESGKGDPAAMCALADALMHGQASLDDSTGKPELKQLNGHFHGPDQLIAAQLYNVAADKNYLPASLWLAQDAEMLDHARAIALYDRADTLGDSSTAQSAATLRRWDYEKTPQGQAAVAQQRQQATQAAEMAPGQPRAIGDSLCQAMHAKGLIHSAQFLNYFEPEGTHEWDRLPRGVTSIALRYQFVFLTHPRAVWCGSTTASS